jgi:hypothetical protein
MTDTLVLKGITFTVESWGDIHQLTCPHCHPGVDFKKDEVLEVEGERYIVYLVGEHSINLQRLHLPVQFAGQSSFVLSLCPPDSQDALRAEVERLRLQLEEAHRDRAELKGHAQGRNVVIRMLEREVERLRAENERLKAFANDILERTFQASLDGEDAQEDAVKHGLIELVTVTEPCSEKWCQCAEWSSFPTECYRKTFALPDPAEGKQNE